MGQKLLPKDCLAAAAAAQRNTRSAENLSLKHLLAGPAGQISTKKLKRRACGHYTPFLVKYMPFFFFARVARPNRWISKKFVFVHRFFGPSDFFRRRFGVQNPSFCLCFLSWQKRFNKQNLQKKCCLPEPRARPRRELIARPPPGRVQNKAIHTSYAHQNFTAQNEGF